PRGRHRPHSTCSRVANRRRPLRLLRDVLNGRSRVRRQTEDQQADDRVAGEPAPRAGPRAGPRLLDPRMAVVWTVQAGNVGAGARLAVLAAEVAVRLASSAGGERLGWPTGLATVVVAVLGGLAVWRLPRAYYRRWSFELAPDALELRHGI